MNIDIVDKIISDKNLNSVKEFFDNLGIIPKIKNGYYYPFTNQAVTIKNVLLSEAKTLGVEILYNTVVLDIKKKMNHFVVTCEKTEYQAKKVVVATGSKAYPKTGSDGMGYSFLEKMGHTIIEPLPALTQLVSSFPYTKEWDGIRTDVDIDVFEDGQFIKRESGEIQLTSYGVSGVCIFNVSNLITRRLKDHEIVLKINFVPFIETLITPWMDQYSKKNNKKNLTLLLEGFLNYKLVPIILKSCKLEGDFRYQDLSKEAKFSLCKSLRSFSIPITEVKSFDSCQICNGGIPLAEINPKTMESKKEKGLYITGELLDMNGYCGGYNLTTCWISGILAGEDLYD